MCGETGHGVQSSLPQLLWDYLPEFLYWQFIKG